MTIAADISRIHVAIGGTFSDESLPSLVQGLSALNAHDECGIRLLDSASVFALLADSAARHSPMIVSLPFEGDQWWSASLVHVLHKTTKPLHLSWRAALLSRSLPPIETAVCVWTPPMAAPVDFEICNGTMLMPANVVMSKWTESGWDGRRDIRLALDLAQRPTHTGLDLNAPVGRLARFRPIVRAPAEAWRVEFSGRQFYGIETERASFTVWVQLFPQTEDLVRAGHLFPLLEIAREGLFRGMSELNREFTPNWTWEPEIQAIRKDALPRLEAWRLVSEGEVDIRPAAAAE